MKQSMLKNHEYQMKEAFNQVVQGDFKHKLKSLCTERYSAFLESKYKVSHALSDKLRDSMDTLFSDVIGDSLRDLTNWYSLLTDIVKECYLSLDSFSEKEISEFVILLESIGALFNESISVLKRKFVDTDDYDQFKHLKTMYTKLINQALIFDRSEKFVEQKKSYQKQ